jgi:hypothetical protein
MLDSRLREILLITVALTVGGIVLALGCSHGTAHKQTQPPPPLTFSEDILTDNLTGCQYVTTSRGGIVPRYDAEGKQIAYDLANSRTVDSGQPETRTSQCSGTTCHGRVESKLFNTLP